MASAYKTTYPKDLAVDNGIVEYLEKFYETSDTPDAHEKYADSFTSDAVLVMASKRCQGRDEILALRKGMWESIQKRHHTVSKIFPFGSMSTEVMLYGIVDYEYKNGQEGKVPWGARAVLVKDGEAWKMSFYQVYLDTGAQKKN